MAEEKRRPPAIIESPTAIQASGFGFLAFKPEAVAPPLIPFRIGQNIDREPIAIETPQFNRFKIFRDERVLPLIAFRIGQVIHQDPQTVQASQYSEFAFVEEAAAAASPVIPVRIGRDVLEAPQAFIPPQYQRFPYFVAPTFALTREAALPLEWLAINVASRLLPIEWRGPLLRANLLPVEWLLSLQAREPIPVEWVAQLLNRGALPDEWRASFVGGRQLPVEWLASLIERRSIPVEWLSTLLEARVLPIEWLGALAAGEKIPVEWLGRLITSGSLPVEWLGRLITSGAIPIEWAGTLLERGQLPIEWLAHLTLTEVLPIEWLKGLATRGTLPVDWTMALALREILPVEWGQPAGLLTARENLPVEWRGALALPEVLPFEWYSSLLLRGALPVEWLAGLIDRGACPVEWTARLIENRLLPVEWLSPILERLTLPVEWLSSLLERRALPIEWLSGLLERRAMPVEWLARLLEARTLPLEWLSRLIASEIIPVEWMTGVVQFLRNNTLPVEWLSHVTLNEVLPVEWFSSLIQSRTLPVEWLKGLLTQGALPVEWLRKLSADLTLPVEWRGRIALSLDEILLIEWQRQAALFGNYLGGGGGPRTWMPFPTARRTEEPEPRSIDVDAHLVLELLFSSSVHWFPAPLPPVVIPRRELTPRPPSREALREVTQRQLDRAMQKAAERVRDWVDGRLDDDAADIARLYRGSRDKLVERLRRVYDDYLGADSTIIRARMSGAMPVIDQSIDQTISELTDYVGTNSTRAMQSMLSRQPNVLRRFMRRVPWKDLPYSTTRVLDELTTRTVGGGTFFDHMFNMTDRLKSDVHKATRTALVNGHDFDMLRDRMMNVFGVDKLADPKSNAYGAVKVYKNAARREWNKLMGQAAGDGAQQVWFAVLDDETTPGCAARHGFRIEDEYPPRHINCRCTILVSDPDMPLNFYQAQGMMWLEGHGYSRRMAMLEESWHWGDAQLITTAHVDPLRESDIYVYQSVPVRALPAMLMYQGQGQWSRDLTEVLAHSNSDHVLLRRRRDTTDVATREGWRALTPSKHERLIETSRGFAVDSPARTPMWDETRYVRAAVVCIEDGLVWAVRPRGTYVWTLPGGGVKDDEALRDAAAREMLEETGLRVTITRRLGVLDRGTSVSVLFQGERIGDREDLHTPEEIDAVMPVPIAHLVDDERRFLMLALREAAFEPGAHPRGKKGSPEGGQFVAKGQGQGGSGGESLSDLRSRYTARGIDNFVGENQHHITLDRVVVPKDQRGTGVGTQFMNDLVRYADSVGKPITLTPSTDFGGSSVSRLRDFYKGFGFVDNKGRNKDFAISDTMYRPVPKTKTSEAFDPGKHPRGKKGSPEGGKFVSGGGSTGGEGGMRDASDWEKSGGDVQTHTFSGGFVRDESGTEYYVKGAADDDHLRTEALSAALYRDAGIASPPSELVTRGGKLAFASQKVAGADRVDPASLPDHSDIKSGFAVDAWLGAWDVAGMSHSNLIKDASGRVQRIDLGGTLDRRAQGGTKAFGPEVGEVKTLRDPKINPLTAKMFSRMSSQDVKDSVRRVSNFSDQQISDHVSAVGFSPSKSATLTKTLIARRDFLTKWANTLSEAYSPDQPRVPAGSSKGGQFGKGGGGGAPGEKGPAKIPLAKPGEMLVKGKELPRTSSQPHGTIKPGDPDYDLGASCETGAELVNKLVPTLKSKFTTNPNSKLYIGNFPNGWNGTSDGVHGSLLRATAADLFGGSVYSQGQVTNSNAVFERLLGPNTLNIQSDQEKVAIRADLKRYVKAQYGFTMKQLGGPKKKIALYRGMGANEVGPDIKNWQQGKIVEFRTGALASFSRDKSTAQAFGQHVVKVKLMAHAVWSFYGSGPGTHGEKEHVVIGDKTAFKALVVRTSGYSKYGSEADTPKKPRKKIAWEDLPDVDLTHEGRDWIRTVARKKAAGAAPAVEAFDSAKHPRGKKGSPEGGRFVAKGQGAAGAGGGEPSERAPEDFLKSDKLDPKKIATQSPSDPDSEPRYWSTSDATAWGEELARGTFGLSPEESAKVKVRSGDGPAFSVGNENYVEGGHFNPNNGEIVAWLDNLQDRSVVEGVLAHECQHAKFRKALPGLAEKGELYNAYHDVLKLTGGQENLALEGTNVSKYAASYWNATLDGKVTTESAMNETLAEVARRKHEKTATGIPGSWNKLYKAFNDEYQRQRA